MKRTLVVLALVCLCALGLSAQSTYTDGSYVTSCANVTTTGPCTAFQFPVYTDGRANILPDKFSWQFYFNAGTASAVTVNLEWSIDSTNGIDGHWWLADGATNTSGYGQSVVNKPSKWMRCNVSAYSIGTTTNLSCGFTAKSR